MKRQGGATTVLTSLKIGGRGVYMPLEAAFKKKGERRRKIYRGQEEGIKTTKQWERGGAVKGSDWPSLEEP